MTSLKNIPYEQLLAALFEAVKPTVKALMIDEDGIIIAATPELEYLFGYVRGELVGKPIEVLVPESKRVVHKEHTAAFFKNPHRRPMTGFEGVTKAGNRVPASIALDCLFLPDYRIKVATAILAESAEQPPPLSKATP